MRLKEEEYIVNQANQLIGQLRIPPGIVSGQLRVAEFSSVLWKHNIAVRLRASINKMNPETLGRIVSGAISERDYGSDFRRALFQDVFPDKMVFFKKTDTGFNSLQDIAFGVVVAAIYDILMTEWWIGNVEEGSVKTEDIPYKPRPAMRIFVRSVRLHDLLQ
jgi:hypothetical protein